jgi:lysophospholipase L1-like esterase
LSGDPADTVTRELAANVILRATWSTFADKLADVGAVTQFDSQADITNTTYYNADQLHLTSAGYVLVANAVYPQIQTLL